MRPKDGRTLKVIYVYGAKVGKTHVKVKANNSQISLT